jgi:hypothetical protein
MPEFDDETRSIKRIQMLFAIVLALLATYAALGAFGAVIVFVVLTAGERAMQWRMRLRRLSALVHEVPRASKVKPADLNIGVTKYAKSFCVAGNPFPPYIERPEDEKVKGALTDHQFVIL